MTAPTGGSWDNIKSDATKIVITGNVTKIGASAFAGFTAATSITLPDSLEVINEGAFNGCSALTSMVIPESVTQIVGGVASNGITTTGSQTFGGCNKLIKVCVLGSDTAVYGKSSGTLKAFSSSETLLRGAFFCALGSGEAPYTKVYNLKEASEINKYLTWGKNNGYYTNGGYADITVEDESGTEQNAADVSLETLDETGTKVTAYFDGIPVANGTAKSWEEGKEFTVTAAKANEEDNISGLPDDCEVSDFVQVVVDEASKNDQTQPMKLTITAKTQNGDKKLKAGTYKFTVSPTTKETNETYKDLTLNLTVTKKTLTEPVLENAVTISNADRSYTLNLDAPIYGGKYGKGNPSLEGTSDEAGQNFISYCPGGIEVGSGDAGSYVKIGLYPNSDINPKNGKSLTGYVNLKVTESDYCEDYSVKIPVTIKGSPAAVAEDNITATDKTIEIKSPDSSCEYAVKASADSEYSDWKDGADGNILFEGLDSATNYTVAVRYKAVGTVGEKGYVSPTLPATTEVTTLQAAPTDQEAQAAIKVDYERETISLVQADTFELYIPNSEADEEPGADTGSNFTAPPSISKVIDFNDSAKRYIYIRKKATTDAPVLAASAWTKFKIEGREDAPGAVDQTKIAKTDSAITINEAVADQEYSIDGGVSWKTMENNKVEFSGLDAGKEYTIITRVSATTTKPASKNSDGVKATTKSTQTAPAQDAVNAAVSTDNNTATTVVVIGQQGYQYIVISNSDSTPTITEEQWTAQGKTATAAGERLEFDKTYDGTQITAGTAYKVLVRLPGDEDKAPSTATASNVVYTKFEAPDANVVTIDYATETITFDDSVYEVYVEKTTSISNNGSITTAIDAKQKLYVRKKADGEIPASEWTEVPIGARPGSTGITVPTVSQDNATEDSITIPNANQDYEYTLVKKGENLDTANAKWVDGAQAVNDTLTMSKDSADNALEEGQEYQIYVRQKASSSAPASEAKGAGSVTVKKTQAAPSISEEDKTGMTATAENTDTTVIVKGKDGLQYILVPADFDVSAGGISEEQWSTNGQTAKAGATDLTFNKLYNGDALTEGTAYKILVRQPADAEKTKMPSPAAEGARVYTKQINPTAEEVISEKNGISIDYTEGRVTLHGDTYEVFVSTDGRIPDDTTRPTISDDNAKAAILEVLAGTGKLYVRKQAKENGQISASEWVPVTIKAEITADKAAIKVGETTALSVALSPAHTGADVTWKWESGDETIAKIEKDEKTGAYTLKALKAGTVTIKATIQNGDRDGSLVVEKTLTITASSSGGSGGYVPAGSEVKTTGSTDNKVTTSPSEVKTETKTDASGKQVTTAKVTVSQTNRREILSQAKSNKSKEIVINVAEKDVKGADSVEVTLDKSFIDSILKDTEANLRVKAPETDKLITREELKQLSGEATGDTVTIDLSKASEPVNPPADNSEKIIKGIRNTSITLKSKLTKKGNVLLTWVKSKGYKVDYYEVYRSVKKNSGYGKKPFFTTKNPDRLKYTNTKSLKKGKTYYYKVRGVRIIDGKKYYTKYSNKTSRTIR